MGILDLLTKAVEQKTGKTMESLQQTVEQKLEKTVGSLKQTVEQKREAKKEKSKSEVELWKEQHEENEIKQEEIYQNFMAMKKRNYEERKLRKKVANIMDKIANTGMPGGGGIGKDYSFFNELTLEERQTEYVKNYIFKLTEVAYQSAVEAYFKQDFSIDMMLAIMNPMTYFDEVREMIQTSLKNRAYFFEEGREISSVLAGKADIQDELNKIMDSALGTEEEIYDFLDFYDKAKDLYERKEYKKAFNVIVHSEYDYEMFDDAKRLLLKTAMFLLNHSNDKDAGDLFEDTRMQVEHLFRANRLFEKEDGTIEMIDVPIADMIIADALVYNRAGLIDNVNKKLEEFIDMGRNNIDRSQYEVLRRVFAFLKAYKQESMVLESMVKYNIPRTELQEQRLVFLRENMNSLNSGSNGNMPKEITYEKENGKLVYDYRCISWNENQIINYFNFLSSEERESGDILVVNEWANNLQIRTGLDWNFSDLVNAVRNGLLMNFGDKYNVRMIESAPLNEDWIEYENSILIEEKSAWKYPWMSFVVNAEQLTAFQISFSIYTLYDVKKDLLNEENLIKRNSKLATKVIAMKSKQNPKINNYISTMQTVLISELEKYLNQNVTVESIY